MEKMLWLLALFAMLFIANSSGNTLEDDNSHVRLARSVKILKWLQPAEISPPPPAVIVPPQPVYKVHKYNGVHLTPLPVTHVPVKVYPQPPPIRFKKRLPSLDDLRSLLGTTSAAETVDALRNLVSTREGLELAMSYLRDYIDDSVDVSRMSTEQVKALVNQYYRYSVPAPQYDVPKPTVPVQAYGVPAENNDAQADFVAPSPKYGIPAPQYSVPKPTVPVQTYGVPAENSDAQANFVAPASAYGIPAKIPKAEVEVPAQVYGVPAENSDVQAEFVAPASTYSVPAEQSKADVVVPVPTYGVPAEENKADVAVPVPTYGVPVKNNNVKPEVFYGVPAEEAQADANFAEPVSNYGPPLLPPKLNYGPPPTPPKISYGLPSPPPKLNYELPPPPPKIIYERPVVQSPHVSYEVPPPPPKISYGGGIPLEAEAAPFRPAFQQEDHGGHIVNDKLLPIITGNGHARPVEDGGFIVHGGYIIPGPVASAYEVPNVARSQVVAFPLMSGLPPVENIVKFRTEVDDDSLSGANSVDITEDRGSPVFSFSSPSFSSVDAQSDDSFRRHVVETRFEQPGFSYTQLSSVPLEEVASSYSSDGVDSFGESLPTYIFDEAAASEQRPILIKPEASSSTTLPSSSARKSIIASKNKQQVASSEVSTPTTKRPDPKVSATIKPIIKGLLQRDQQRPKWVPKAKRKPDEDAP